MEYTDKYIGVHTIELTIGDAGYARPPAIYNDLYTNRGYNRYSISIPKLPQMSEYSSLNNTQEAINRVKQTFYDEGHIHTYVSRIDFRIDNYRQAYRENVTDMRVIVYLVAYIGGIFYRAIDTSKWNIATSSVRAMPYDEDTTARYGIEYYDKEWQKNTQKYGRARLEFRRLNLHNECVSFVVKEWKQLLLSITKKQYKNMLKKHAEQLILEINTNGVKHVDLMSKLRPYLICKEEEGIVLKMLNLPRNHYKCGHLPDWKQTQNIISSIVYYFNLFLAGDNSTKIGEKQIGTHCG